MPLADRTFSAQATRLLDHYRAGEPVDRFSGWLDELDIAFTASETVTDDLFTAAVTRCIQKRTERGLPLVADLRQYVDAVRPDFVRAASLPPPVRHPSRPDPVAFAWNVAIGRARARKRFALIDAYRKANGLDARAPVPESVWHGLDEPTEAEIRAVSGEALPPMVAAVTGGRGADVPGVPSWPGAQRG